MSLSEPLPSSGSSSAMPILLEPFLSFLVASSVCPPVMRIGSVPRSEAVFLPVLSSNHTSSHYCDEVVESSCLLLRSYCVMIRQRSTSKEQTSSLPKAAADPPLCATQCPLTLVLTFKFSTIADHRDPSVVECLLPISLFALPVCSIKRGVTSRTISCSSRLILVGFPSYFVFYLRRQPRISRSGSRVLGCISSL